MVLAYLVCPGASVVNRGPLPIDSVLPQLWWIPPGHGPLRLSVGIPYWHVCRSSWTFCRPAPSILGIRENSRFADLIKIWYHASFDSHFLYLIDNDNYNNHKVLLRWKDLRSPFPWHVLLRRWLAATPSWNTLSSKVLAIRSVADTAAKRPIGIKRYATTNSNQPVDIR